MSETVLSADDDARAAVANENARSAYTDEETDTEALLTVHGYRFIIEEDAEAARTDQVRIEHLNRYLKGGKTANILPLYEKSIQNRIFSTPVGWEYLQSLRGILIDQGTDPADIPPIPVGVPVTRRRLPGDYHTRERIAETPPEPVTWSAKTSFVLNIILAVLVVVMFIIASTSKTDNILNYRRNVTNEYSTWAEELSNRESQIRQRERELGISHSSVTDAPPTAEPLPLENTEIDDGEVKDSDS